jgi:hypothetical protein
MRGIDVVRIARSVFERWRWREQDALLVSDRWLDSAVENGFMPPGEYRWVDPETVARGRFDKGYRLAWDKDRRARIKRRVKNKNGQTLVYRPR